MLRILRLGQITKLNMENQVIDLNRLKKTEFCEYKTCLAYSFPVINLSSPASDSELK